VHGSVDGIQGGKNLYGFFLENAPGKKKKKKAPKLNRNLMYIYKTEMKKYKHTPW